MTCVRCPFAVLVAGLLAACGGGGGGGGTTSGPGTSTAPSLAKHPGATTRVFSGSVVNFTLDVDDAEHDAVSLRLQNPPPGLTFLPIHDRATPYSAAVHWNVTAAAIGIEHLQFAAVDATGRTTLLDVPIRIEATSNNEAHLFVADVTGDGRLDCLCVVPTLDLGGFTDVGAILVWAGAASPSGTPTATLTAANGANSLQVGGAEPTTLVLADVTGDGILDVISASDAATVAGQANAGAIYVWKGGPSLNGVVTESALLVEPAPTADDELHYVYVDDVTGDGVLDVIGLAPKATVGGFAGAGRALVWKGGATLTLTPAPLATLENPSPQTNDGFPVSSGERAAFADLTGDNIDDLVLPDRNADWNGHADSGVVFVWAGGATLTGTPAPLASCAPSTANNGDKLPDVSGSALVFGDVTGDGVLDLVTGAKFAKISGVVEAGAAYVFAGGATLTGAVNPTATLTLPGPLFEDRLCNVFAGKGIQLADVSGDGKLDLVVGATKRDLGAIVDAGALYMWKGGGTLTGSPAPDATLTLAAPANGDELGTANGESFVIGDVTGDGVPDVIACSASSDFAAVDAGAIFVFKGGPTLTGNVTQTATLRRNGAQAGDVLGIGSEAGILLEDVSGDGMLDVIGAAPSAQVGGVAQAGAVLVWNGGASLTGTVMENAELTIPSALANDRLGDMGTTTIQLGDVTGDGKIDLVIGTKFRDKTVSVTDVGGVFVWAGGGTLIGTPPPLAMLFGNLAVKDDRICSPSRQSMQIADIDDDGIGDVIAFAGDADTSGVVDAGAVFIWTGGATLSGTPAARARLKLSAPVIGDRLGATGIGLTASGAPGLFADVNGDNVLDLVVASPFADVGGIANAGALQFFAGGATLTGLTKTPDLTLTTTTPTMNDDVGN